MRTCPPDINTSYILSSIIMKTVWYLYCGRHMDQWNRSVSSGETHVYIEISGTIKVALQINRANYSVNALEKDLFPM